MKVADFGYDLPEEAIAQEAIEPRHASRLLDTRDMSDHRFLELADLLAPDDLVVVNETKVRAARLIGRRHPGGGRVEVLLLERGDDGTWQALAKPARKLQPGMRLVFGDLQGVVTATGTAGVVHLSIKADDVEAAIESAGTVPLPPYFSGELASSDRYQTLFANQPGSAAAPTAGLHFTGDVLESLNLKGIPLATVDLHVSLDTFRPMTVDRVEHHEIHSEWCTVPEATAAAVGEARGRGGRVVAVGTTVVRTLESFAGPDGGVTAGTKSTDLFLKPGSVFRVVDSMVTNFHMPRSTLLVLLAAFMGPRWRSVYETALQRGYRFLSFGDAMYVERHDS